MKNKEKFIKDLIFYGLAALFIIIVLVIATLEANNIILPVWLTIVLAVVEIGLFVTETVIAFNRNIRK